MASFLSALNTLLGNRKQLSPVFKVLSPAITLFCLMFALLSKSLYNSIFHCFTVYKLHGQNISSVLSVPNRWYVTTILAVTYCALQRLARHYWRRKRKNYWRKRDLRYLEHRKKMSNILEAELWFGAAARPAWNERGKRLDWIFLQFLRKLKYL